MIYSTDIVIGDSLQEHGKFALYYASERMEFDRFDTYEEAKAAAIRKAKKYKAVSVYLWGHSELEPDIPMLISNPGYRQLA
jgi:alpha-beta hydrolase superfamily lysophospholipase